MAPETPIQVLDIGVEWHAQYANDPSLCFLLDRQPEYGRYDKRPCAQEQVSGEQAAIIGSRMRNERKGWHLYWSQDGDFAWFFTWGGKPDDGFGGWRRTITLLDGTEEEIVGGWHTGPQAATDVGHPACVDVAYRTDYFVNRHTGEKRLSGGTTCFVTEERLRMEVARLLRDVEVIEGRYGGVTVKWRGQPSKAEFLDAQAKRREPIRKALEAKYGGYNWYSKITDAEHESLTERALYADLGPAAVAMEA
jgi:hypothetical protein